MVLINVLKKLCRACEVVKPHTAFWSHEGHSDGRCSVCITCERSRRARYRARPENVEKYRKNSRDWWSNLRAEVHSGYGNVCACCGETEPRFLTLGHVVPCGTEHRKEMGGTQGTYKDARDRNFPSDYQLLCFNCNCAKGHYGVCPHKEARGEKEPDSEFYRNGRVVRRPQGQPISPVGTEEPVPCH